MVDTSDQSYKDYIWARQHGLSLAAAIAGWKQNPAAAAWQAKLAKLDEPPPPPPVPESYYIFSFEVTPDDPLHRPLAGAMRFTDALQAARQYETDHPGSVVRITEEVSDGTAAAPTVDPPA
jgi:hypothetical protein